MYTEDETTGSDFWDTTEWPFEIRSPFIFDLEEQPSQVIHHLLRLRSHGGRTEWDCVYRKCGKLSLTFLFALSAGSTWSDGSSRESCWLVLSNLTPQVNTHFTKTTKTTVEENVFLDLFF